MSRPAGAIAWMVRHRVAPNLLMLALILGGLAMSGQIRQEVFPSFAPEAVVVQVAYPGAAPAEVEQGVLLAIEEAVSGVDDLEEVRATASEGSARLVAEMRQGGDFTQFYQDLRQTVDRVGTLPEDAEAPDLSAQSRARPVLDLQVHADVDEAALRAAAVRIREGLLAAGGVSEIELAGARDPVVRVVVSDARLRPYGLGRRDVAELLSREAVDRPGGLLETPSGDLLVGVRERRDAAAALADLPLIAAPDGGLVRLGDVADITAGFADSGARAVFDGRPAIGLRVFRTGDETPIGVSEAVRGALPGLMAELPEAFEAEILNDRSEIYAERVELLLRNGFVGLLLVLGLLSLFLQFRLAFWVVVGIPTVFVGVLIFLPIFGVSLNMISLFAFILALGIVVDDAIVAGENIHEHLRRGESRIDAAIAGAREIAVPISFSILTNAAAFMPLAAVPGAIGALWVVFPAVVVTALAISWIEALFVLPAHLAHGGGRAPAGRTGLAARAEALRRAFADGLDAAAERAYGRALRFAMRFRYAAIACAVAVLIAVVAIPASGKMAFVFLPRVAADSVEATAALPADATDAGAAAVAERLGDAARRVAAAHGGEAALAGLYVETGETRVLAEAYLPDPEVRALDAGAFAAAWRREVGALTNVRALRFASEAGPGAGPALTIRLSHEDAAALERAAATLADALAERPEVGDVDDGVGGGKPRIDLTLTPTARAFGLSAAELGAQVRAAHQGTTALRRMVGRDEVEIRVEAPAADRDALSDLRGMTVRLPDGGEAPLARLARFSTSESDARIERLDGRRIVEVTADVSPADAAPRIARAIEAGVLADLRAESPGLEAAFGGRDEDRREQFASFGTTVPLALLAIYALLAIPLRSYLQPAIVMAAIPFGVVGAILGHAIMGFSLSIISILGIIALSGVVVNGSLILIDYANRKRDEGLDAFEAAHRAGVRRLRPILLTTLTTFGGLAPMIFETSMQARFLVPMAVSLGFGVLFAAAVLIFLTPCLYLAVEDVRGLSRRARTG